MGFARISYSINRSGAVCQQNFANPRSKHAPGLWGNMGMPDSAYVYKTVVKLSHCISGLIS